MDIKKMRRTLERSAEAQEAEAHRRWLASLTPEHRAKHERPVTLATAGPCGECLRAGLERMNAQMRRIRERQEARRSAS